MKGDGEDRVSVVRDFLSLRSTHGSGGGGGGSSSRSSGSGSASGSEGVSGRGEADASFSSMRMLSSLSRNGLSMLAGGSSGGFSLKPPAVGSLGSLRNLAMMGGGAPASSKVTGGGFTGFYRKNSVNNNGSSSSARMNGLLLLPGMKLRLGKEDDEERTTPTPAPTGGPSASRIAGKGEHSLQMDVENLTPDECWRLILKLGSRWPAWNGSTATQAPQGVAKGRSSTKGEHVQGLQLGQDSLRFLAGRALEALAQTPDRHGRPAGGMLAPKWTTQEIAKTKAAMPASKSTQRTLAALVDQPSSLAKVPVCASLVSAAPKVSSIESRTAPLTIFYAGTVNVCENVPEDKARLIMLFADKAGSPLDAQASSALTDTSPHVIPLSKRPLEMVRREEELQLSKPSSEVAVMTSSAPSDLAPSSNHAEGPGPEQTIPSGSSTETVPAELSPVPVKITITEDKSRHHRQQGTAKPLPNARKNSLARFLDSRKRNRPSASCSEGPPTKRPALSDGGPSDAEDVKGNSGMSPPMPLCSQSSINSKEGMVGCGYNDSEMRD